MLPLGQIPAFWRSPVEISPGRCLRYYLTSDKCRFYPDLSNPFTVNSPIFLLCIILPSAALLIGRSRDRFPVVSLNFSVTYSIRTHHDPGVDSAPSENGYQEHFLGVKAAGAWGWQPYHLHVPNVMKIWEPKPPGTLWATPGLLRDCFTSIMLPSVRFFRLNWLRIGYAGVLMLTR
jgi:hypothetical protein